MTSVRPFAYIPFNDKSATLLDKPIADELSSKVNPNDRKAQNIAGLDVVDLKGIGGRRRDDLHAFGVYTIGDLAGASVDLPAGLMNIRLAVLWSMGIP